MKVFTTPQIRQLDRTTIDKEPISSLDLMERASNCFVEAFTREVTPSSPIRILAGPGNNGGDALATARMLHQAGYTVDCYLFNLTGKLSPDCQANRDRLHDLPVSFTEITDKFTFPELKANEVIIDGLFGSGLNKPLSGIYAETVRQINQSDSRVYSIDIPSGLFGEDNRGNTTDTIVKADKTFTFGSPKLAFLLPDFGIYTGEWQALYIGLSPIGIAQTATPYYITTPEEINRLIRPRDKFAYKNQFGHALLMAGSRGKIGAAVLSAQACLRSGAGLITCYLPQCGETIMQTAFPEAMVETDPETDYLTTLPYKLDTYSALAIGPGIGLQEKTGKQLAELLTDWRKPLVIDADGINLIAQDKELLLRLPRHTILTPHIGEFDRLAGKSQSGYERLQKARQMAVDRQCIIILKGAYTAVCCPEGNVYFNPTGNPGMATAGSGDVLTGILLGLLAQGYPPLTAARLGVYLHGEAGDKAAQRRSQQAMIARDIIDCL